jgi:hypothetical protein
MRNIFIISLFVLFISATFNSLATFADGNINVTPNAVKVECINLTGRTSSKLIDICCVDDSFEIIDGTCLGSVTAPLSLENMSRTCIAPGMHLAFTLTFLPCPCGGECAN